MTEFVVEGQTDARWSTSATDATIYLELLPSALASGQLHRLDNPDQNDFQRGSVDRFVISDFPNLVQNMKWIRLHFFDANSTWLPTYVKVIPKNSPDLARIAYVNQEFQGDGNGLDTIATFECKPLHEKPVEVLVKTGSLEKAGTDAKVYLQLIHQLPGAISMSAQYRLDNPGLNDFVRGTESRFRVMLDKQWLMPGWINQIRMFHDNTGDNPGWFLEYVKVLDLSTGRDWTAMFDRWLKQDTGLEATGIAIEGQEAGVSP